MEEIATYERILKMVPFGDLSREYRELKTYIDSAYRRVVESGWFILGARVEEFESAFARYLNSPFCITCGSGTDALALSLRALGIGPGDEVITVSHTACPTAMAISMVYATPVFTEISQETYLMDVSRVAERITKRTKAIIPVHLYGQPVDMAALSLLAKQFGIPIIEDCAQAHGAMLKNRKCGTFGTLAAFSFYPSKNLGCYGDGGAVVTSDPELAERIRSLRNYGQRQRYFHETLGVNSRLDELQAGILLVKLQFLDQWNQRRRSIAARYVAQLSDLPIVLPKQTSEATHVYHLFVIQTKERDRLKQYLEAKGIQTQIHYPVPVHLQRAYCGSATAKDRLPITEAVASSILSLPIFPQLSDSEVDEVSETIRRFFEH